MKQIKSLIKYMLLLLSLVTCTAVAQTQTRTVGPDGPDDPTLQCKVKVEIPTGGGTVSPNEKTLTIGESCVFTITPNKSWTIGSVSLDGVQVAVTGNAYTLKAAKSSHTLTVSFVQNLFSVNVVVDPVGAGTVSPMLTEVTSGTDFIFTIRPTAGYTLKEVRAQSGKKCESTGKDDEYKLEDVTADDKVTVTFSPPQYEVSVTNGGGGTLTSPASGKYPYGTELNITAAPDAGYEVDRITVNSIPLSGSKLKVTGDMAFHATFKKKQCTITVFSQEGGKLAAKSGTSMYRNGSYAIPYGTVLQLEQEAVAGYTFKKYDVTPSGALSGDKVTVVEDISIKAVFEKNMYKVTVTQLADTEGKLLIDGEELSGDKDYGYGTVLQLSNVPGTGKTLSAYNVSPASALNGNLVTVTTAVTIGATFKTADPGKQDPDDPDDPSKKIYAVTFPSGVSVRTAGAAITSGTYVKEKSELTIIVSNTSKTLLASLSANGTKVDYLVSGDVNMGYYTVTGTTDIQPVFKNRTYKVTLGTPVGGYFEALTDGKAVVSGQEMEYGKILTVNATSEEGYKLQSIMANTLDITLSGKVTLTEDVKLNVTFGKQSGFDPDPDPSNPDPDRPLSVDMTPQQVIYNREVQNFRVLINPVGATGGVTVGYAQNGKTVTPQKAGLYDVTLKRPADAQTKELNVSIPGGLEILKAPVTIQSVKVDVEEVVGTNPKTTATLKSGVATYAGKEVKGSFVWMENNTVTLETLVSAYHPLRFIPEDKSNYLEANTQYFVQVGSAPPTSYRITWEVSGKGHVNVHNGSMPVRPDALFYAGTVLTLEAAGEEGHRFVHHETGGGSFADNPCMLVVNSDLTVKSVFEQKKNPANPGELTITITDPLNPVYDGQAKLVTVSSSPALTGWKVEYKDSKGNSVIPRNAGQYTVSVTRAEDNEWQAASISHSFTVKKATPGIIADPIATSIPKKALLGDSHLSGGVASVDGFGVVSGVFRWMDGTEKMETAGIYDRTVKFSPVDPDNIFSVTKQVQVTVIEKSGGGDIPVIITYDIPSGGSLSVTDTQNNPLKSGDEVAPGTNLVVRVSASSGYKLTQLVIGGIDYTAQAIAGSGMVEFIATASKHIYARFTSIPPDPPGPTDYYTIWVTTSGNGSVHPGTTQVSSGSNVTFVVTPDEGFYLIDVRINGKSVGAVSSYTFNNVQADATLAAVFSSSPENYTLTARVAGTGGIVSPSLARVSKGGRQSFLIVPNQACKIADVRVGSSEKDLRSVGTPLMYAFTNVRADSLLVVSFSTVTSIETIETAGLHAYAEEKILHLDTDKTVDVYVYDIAGVMHYSGKVYGHTEVRNLAAGMHFVVFGKGYKVVKVWIRQ